MPQTVFAHTYGYTATDATQALQDALNDPNASQIIVRNMGQPWYISRTVFVPSNKTIIFQPGVVVQAKPGTFLNNTSPMIRAVNVENVRFIGRGTGENRATLKMNKEEYNTLEYGHVLGISGVTNFRVEGLRLTGAGGDGLYIDGVASVGRHYSENGVVRNIIATNNRRQGLSVISAKNLVIEDSVFEETNGTAPSAGIDFEPDLPNQRLQNIKLNNLEFRNNRGAGLKFALGNLTDSSVPVSITASNLWIENNQSGGIAVQLWNQKDQVNRMINGRITINDAQVVTTGGRAGIEGDSAGIILQDIPGPSYDANNLKVNFNRVTIANSSNDSGFYSPILINGYDNVRELGNLRFKNVVVRDGFQRSILQAFLDRSDSYLNRVSGNIVGFNPNGVSVDYDPETPPRNLSLVVRDGAKLTGPKLVRNGTFEKGQQNWQIATARIAPNPVEGGRGLKIDSLTGYASQDITTGLSAGKDYVLSGKGMLSNLGSSGTVSIRYWDDAGNVLSSNQLPFKNVEMLELSLGFTTPDSFASAELFIQKAKGKGSFWVDDIQIVAQQGGEVSRGF